MKNLYRNTAWLYDVDNRDLLTADIPFYLEYAKQLGGEVLELGCGTGRCTLALARPGFSVTALDLSKQMLHVFEQKLNKEPNLKKNVSLIHGNMADFDINRKFSLIIAPFRAFQALTKEDDIQNSLDCIKKHLSDEGAFIITAFNPHPVMDESWCYDETVQWVRIDENTGNHVVKKHWGDKIDIENQIIYPHYAYEVTYQNGEKERFEEDLELKYYYESQLQNIIEHAGFLIKEKFGWYDKTSIKEARQELIFVCGKNG